MAAARDKYVLYTDAAGETRWKRVARNGRIVGNSGEGYKRFGKARDAIFRQDSSAEVYVEARGRLIALATFEDTR